MPGAPIDLEALAARVMRPERPALADARAAVAGLVDPRGAWLALAHRGSIPSDWIDAPSRRFAARSRKREPDEPTRQVRLAGLHVLPHPARVDDAITVAASARSIGVAEAHAREAARRIGAAPDVPVVWRIAARWNPTGLRWRRMKNDYDFHILPPAFVRIESGASARRFAYALRRASGMNGGAVGDLRMHEFWRLAATTDARVPESLDALSPWRRYAGRRFADVPNPLDPWIAVWSLGFGIAAIRDDAIVLVAPRVRDEASPGQ
ncbi:hypothetical protein SAMN02745121_07434 [Nannocystis exedens]|uniref:Uncharacterized protein n=1 Tax=Nannocystis exedens TaxID=54 RepID=A0A1I2GQF6_9BACT|nr:hypothetical protein [Nannocystis exedens]PCC68737.1 hypothetical protein NAEX_01754 [Nannocystis exedens]SFF19463.1 hypothetical protein SAMN02745121_07434 [Nannocystis exedens]